MTDDEPSRSEEQQRRLDKQLDQLLQEARVVMPGVQILFAFLLAVPFQQRFAATDGSQRDVYLLALLAAAVATICFIAPAAYHRILFERCEKDHLIRIANRYLIAGLAAMAVAMSASVLLVVDLWFHAGTVATIATLLTLLFAWFWFGLPLARRFRVDRSA
jgi:hypothetical protein